MTTLEPTLTFDFRKTQNKNRLKGLWQMMEDYRLPYLGATLALAGAALAKTFTYLLLAYFADDVITQGPYIDGNMTRTFLYIGLGFVVLALFEGGFSFLSGRLAAYTAEGIYTKKGGPFDIPFPEIIKRAKEKPDTIKAGVGGTWTGSDVVRFILEDATGAKFIRIPHPAGGQDLVPGALGGHLDIAMGEGAQWAPLYTAGKFNVLAVRNSRSPVGHQWSALFRLQWPYCHLRRPASRTFCVRTSTGRENSRGE